MDILDLLHPRDVYVRKLATAKRPLLRQFADHFADRSRLPPDVVFAALLNRERLGSTGIGNGVALPHAFVHHKPSAALAILQRPIWFRTPDGLPVDIVLAVIWPRDHAMEFMQALSRVCRLLSRSELRENIRCASSPEEVLTRLQDAVDGRPGEPALAMLAGQTRREGRL
ncbi:PTS sugar transporter subunit IIA [Nitratireductor mangrovi]|uniref:PTS sugar transporter subunit IIA n=1 Tax=Nitratireductor mangrovi TaxID=2599600 RepID=A0A5B8L721_9HYPH|nr:PTS sugar transporter subunit IIA [Nitratireductor mangrovi]